MRQILSVSMEELEIEYIFYLSCFYNMTVSEYIRSVLRDKWYQDEIYKVKIKKPLNLNEFQEVKYNKLE